MPGISNYKDSGRIILYYKAKVVNIVAGSDSVSTVVSSVNNVLQKEINVSSSTLYNVVSANDYSPKTLELNITGKGFKIYTFTFG